MRLDTHLHMMLRPFYGRAATDPEKLLSDMSECGLDGGWVSVIDSMTTSDLRVQKKTHDKLAEITRRYPGRIEGYSTVHPRAMEDAAREVERCVSDLGFIGVKLHPWVQAFSVTHPGVGLIMEAAGFLGVPVLFHDGTPPYSTTTQAAWLAGKYPNTTVILGHGGFMHYWRDAVEAARVYENIWLQPSAAPPMTIRAALDAVGTERFLFGADGGFGTAKFLRYVVSKYRAALGDELFGTIAEENPTRLLEKCKKSANR